MWLADRVDEALEEYRETHGIASPWETRERVVVAITGAPSGDDVIRRAARMAARTHGELIGVHVRSSDGLRGPQGSELDDQRRLLDELGGEYREIAGADTSAALVQFAHARERDTNRAGREPAVVLDAPDPGIGDHQRDPRVG